MRIQRGDRGSRPGKNTKIGFSSNTGPDPLKHRSCQASIQCWAFRWRADDAPLIMVLGPSLPSSTKKTLSNLGPPLADLGLF